MHAHIDKEAGFTGTAIKKQLSTTGRTLKAFKANMYGTEKRLSSVNKQHRIIGGIEDLGGTPTGPVIRRLKRSSDGLKKSVKNSNSYTNLMNKQLNNEEKIKQQVMASRKG